MSATPKALRRVPIKALPKNLPITLPVEECPQGQARSGTANAMTIDVEDYFQVEAFASTIERSSWENLPRRVERNTQRLLDILAETEVQATFFILGWVAKRHPALMRRIVAGGHELASHGSDHARVDHRKQTKLRQSVRLASPNHHHGGSRW